jgi:hypothetical protein
MSAKQPTPMPEGTTRPPAPAAPPRLKCNACWRAPHLGFCGALEESFKAAEQKTGGSVDYYKCHVADPISGGSAYTAESIDIIEALGMTFAEGEAFKAIWRTCTGRMGGAVKADNKALYNAEKVEFFGARMVRAAKRSEAE